METRDAHIYIDIYNVYVNYNIEHIPHSHTTPQAIHKYCSSFCHFHYFKTIDGGSFNFFYIFFIKFVNYNYQHN